MIAAIAFAAALSGQSALEQMRGEASRAIVHTESRLGRAFMLAAQQIPGFEPRQVYRKEVAGRKLTLGAVSYAKLPEAEQEGWTAEDLTSLEYYYTGYGTPLAYGRVLDVLGQAGVTSISGKRICDFGCGTLGHLQVMARLGADTVGIDPDPWLRELYSDPSDQYAPSEERRGGIRLISGYWPGDPLALAEAGKFDIFTSKNTLKRGYIHPDQKVDPRRTVNLGVSDEAFLNTLYSRLNEGGWVVIYNISGAQPEGGYNPSADGRNPFPQEAWEKAGFTTVAYDVDDSENIRKWGAAFGWGEPEELETGFFAMVSVFKKGAAPAQPEPADPPQR